MESTLECALNLVNRGFFVFPCKPNSKVPAHVGWQEEATNDPEAVKKLWTDPTFNVGIFTSKFGKGEALLVVDVDVKDGRDGVSSWRELASSLPDLKSTLVQKTPTGGFHIIYKVLEPVKQGTDVLGSGLDIRSRGGYIVGAGSVINGVYYSMEANNGLAAAPQTLLDRVVKERPELRLVEQPSNVDQEQAAKRAVEYLSSLEPAQKGNRNERAFKTAAVLKDMGLNSQNAFSAMLEHWKVEGVDFTTDELQAAVQSAYRYGQNSPGVDAPENVFTKIEGALTERPRSKLFAVPFKECVANLNQPYLIEHLIDPGCMSVVYGDSNTGKSFFALDLAVHLAVGKTWINRKVKRGSVAYVAAEAGNSMKKRIEAYKKFYELQDDEIDFVLIPCPVDLLHVENGDARPLAELILEHLKEPKLIVVDTLARALAGGNENSSEDMGAFVRNVDVLRYHTKAHVMVIHHSGKDRAQGARGHSSLRAAVDTEIEVSKSGEGSVQAHKAVATKQRDRELGTPIEFKLEEVELGKNSEGMLVKSCVVRPVSEAEKAFKRRALKPGSLAYKLMDVLDNLRESLPLAPAEWSVAENARLMLVYDCQDAFFNANKTLKNNKKRDFERAITKCVEHGLLEVRGDEIIF